MQQLNLQLEEEGNFVNKKFKGADSFFITEAKAIADPPQSPDPFFPVTQDTPLGTPPSDKISNLQTELPELQTKVVAIKSFILEQFLLIKQTQKIVNEKSISNYENNSELIKSLLNQIEYLRRENSIKSNIISNLWNNNKVLFNNEEKHNNINNSNFENSKCVVKSTVISEDYLIYF